MRDPRRMLTLLLLGLIGEGTNAGSVAIQQSQSLSNNNLITNLEKSELDLKSFLVSKNKVRFVNEGQENEEDESDDEEENDESKTQIQQKIKTNLKVDADDDDQEEEDEEKVQTKSEITSKSQTRSQYGRDKNGMFNNHRNYVKLRNKINEQESGHQDMFDTINEKLQDNSFIQQAIEMKGQTESKTVHKLRSKGAANTISSQSDAGMSDADVKCYEARYGDLAGTGAREHFLEYGSEEGRLKTCAANLTSYQAQRYLNMNPDLQRGFGRGSKNAKDMARDQYVDYGYKQANRSIAVPSWDALSLCGDTPRSSCKCPGTVHYGFLETPDNNSTVKSLAEMREWNTYEKVSDGKEWVTCTHTDFGLGKEPDPEQRKQCWCEPKPMDVPTTCANDGGDCLCNGLVFYMKKVGTTNIPSDFYTAIKQDYTVNNANNTGKIKCTKSNFEGVNPLPGEDKQCFCDENQLQMTATTVQGVKEYWRSMLEELMIEEAKLALEEEERLAHIRYTEEQKLLEEQATIRIKAQKEAMAKLKAESAEAAAKHEEERKAALAEAKKERQEIKAQAKADRQAAKAKFQAAEAAKQKAREKKAAAKASKHEEEKQRLLEEAEKEEADAVAESVKASKEEAAAKQAEELQDLKEKQEEASKKAEAEAKVEAEKKAVEAEEAAKAEEEQRKKADDAKKAAEEKAREEHAATIKLKYEQQLSDALDRQKTLLKAKFEAENAARIKSEQEEQARLDLVQAGKDREAEQARIAAEEADAEEKRVEAAAEAAADALKKKEDAEDAERRKLEKDEHDKAMALQKAKDALLHAQKQEQLATSAAAIAAAQEIESAAQAAVEAANKKKKEVLAQKAQLKEDIEAAKQVLAQAKKSAGIAAATKAFALKHSAQWKEMAAKGKEDAKKAIAAANAEAAEYTAHMKVALEANDKKHLASVKAAQEDFVAMQAALRAAHEAKERARKELEARQIAQHKKLMAERRAHFEHKFKFVWTTGPTGCSVFHLTTTTAAAGEKVLSDIFSKTLAADVQQTNSDLKRRINNNQGADATQRDNQHRITGVTSDERVAELVEVVAAHNLGSAEVAFDLIITPLAAASPDYVEWVQLQTMKKDPELAFYNVQAEDEIYGLNNKVGQIGHVEDLEAMKSTHVDHLDDDHHDDHDLVALAESKAIGNHELVQTQNKNQEKNQSEDDDEEDDEEDSQ